MSLTLTTLQPNSGRALGDTYMIVKGTGFLPPIENPGARTDVFFNGVLARETGVVSPTEIRCITPPGDPDASCTVTVANVVPNPPSADIVTPGLNSLPYTFKRPDISTPADRANHGLIAIITAKVVSDLRQFVIKEVHHDMHPDYANPTDALVPETHLAQNPHIKVLGPKIDEDPFYRQLTNERLPQDEVSLPGVVSVYDQPIPVKFSYDYIGVARTSAEAGNLYEALARFIRAVPEFHIVINGTDHLFEFTPLWDDRADFSKSATKNGVYQFSGGFVIRGANLLGNQPEDKISETRKLEDQVRVTITQKNS